MCFNNANMIAHGSQYNNCIIKESLGILKRGNNKANVISYQIPSIWYNLLSICGVFGFD